MQNVVGKKRKKKREIKLFLFPPPRDQIEAADVRTLRLNDIAMVCARGMLYSLKQSSIGIKRFTFRKS